MRKENLDMEQKLIDEIRKMPNDIDNISNITEKIINDLKSKRYPIPIVNIMKELNFIVGKQRLEDDLSGYIVINDEIEKKFGKKKMICVNSNDSWGHQRFTIAHELAHYLFDYNMQEPEFYNTYRTTDVNNDIEIRANTFAANLLMPEKEFKKQYDKYYDDIDLYSKLEEYFQVSRRAIDRRIIELGLN